MSADARILSKVQVGQGDWHRIHIDTAIRTPPPPRTYIVGHLPEESGIYGMVIGPDGSRKSWLALHIAVAVAGGRPVAGSLWPARPAGRVVYLTSEDSAQELWRRLHAIGHLDGYEWVGDLDDHLDIIPLSAGAQGLTLVCPDGTNSRRFMEHPSVAALIAFCRGSRLVLIDPLADMVEASENDDQAASLTVRTLRRISRETGAGVLIVHHQNKSAMAGGDSGNQTARGSSKIPAGARWSVTLQPLSPGEAEEKGIADRERWTIVREGKASYAMRESDGALYHWPEILDPQGMVTGGVPLARTLPDKGSSGAPIRTPRGLANLVGVNAQIIGDDDDRW